MQVGRRSVVLAGVGATLGAGVALALWWPPGRGPAVPRARVAEASILGLPNERFLPELPGGTDALRREFIQAIDRQRRALGLIDGAPPPARNMLAISGGGEDGAFSAGLLCGWTDHGTRPDFHLVTGVSTGALIAPFAFAGTSQDARLRELYATIRQGDVMVSRSYIRAMFDDGLADDAPLLATIARYIDSRMLADIARGHAEGRLLLIATVNLDAQLAVLWNIGAIAASGHPGALDLVGRVMLASAAIPGLFPPTMLDATLDGRAYQEMHVDGDAFAQSFLYPSSFGEQRRERLRTGQPVTTATAYVIRNAQHDTNGMETERRTLAIALRAIAALTRASGHNDIERIYAYAERDGIDFNLAFIGPDFTYRSDEPFDPRYMRQLFDYGYRQARQGYPRAKRPPF